MTKGHLTYVSMYKSLPRLSRVYIRALKFPGNPIKQEYIRQVRIASEYWEMVKMEHDCGLMICNHNGGLSE